MELGRLKKRIFNNKALAAVLILLMITTLGIGGVFLSVFGGFF